MVTQENHYDPWGIAIEQEVVADKTKLPSFELRDRFTYNGKELQGTLNYLDYGARMYDATIGRWGVVDPLMEKWHTLSPYVFVNNNPLSYIDPDGRDLVRIQVPDGNGGTKYAIVDSKIAKHAHSFAWKMFGEYGVVVTDSYRTDLQQLNVSGSGGLKAKVGRSRHQQGFALDFGVNKAFYKLHGRSATNEETTNVGEYGESLKLDWRYKLKDYPHFELTAMDYGYESLQDAYEINKKYYKSVGGEEGIPIMDFTPKMVSESKSESKKETLGKGQLQMKRDATQVQRSSFIIDIRNFSEGLYRVVDGKLVKE